MRLGGKIMVDFSWLKKYSGIKEDSGEYKHDFVPLNCKDIFVQEERLGYPFPTELREFYLQVGYGIMCAQDEDYLNMIMAPNEVADFMLGEGMYGNSGYRNEIDLKTKMVFLYVGDETYLCLDVGEKDSEGRCPVVYVKPTKCVVLARSLEEFAKKMDESMSYYVDIW